MTGISQESHGQGHILLTWLGWDYMRMQLLIHALPLTHLHCRWIGDGWAIILFSTMLFLQPDVTDLIFIDVE